MNLLNIARIAHEVNRAYCLAIGDTKKPKWEDAEEWRKESLLGGIKQLENDPKTTPEESHESWVMQKINDGWDFGEEENTEAKTHPCIVPYSELPEAQKVKDSLFIATVTELLQLKKEFDKQNTETTKVPVQYIGFRPNYSDGIYGTGDWAKDQIKLVERKTAVKMFEHADVYIAPVEEVEGAEEVEINLNKPKPDDDDSLEEGRTAVMTMSRKKEIIDFVASNFGGIKIDLPKTAKVADYRDQAILLIDQYHLP